MRYDAESLHGEFGGRFRLVQSSKELHQTPIGTAQQFLYCYCRPSNEVSYFLHLAKPQVDSNSVVSVRLAVLRAVAL
jgi:hypothetical protein